jgi:hypothetical protein
LRWRRDEAVIHLSRPRIADSDLQRLRNAAPPLSHYHADYNAGADNTIYAGGDKPSYLLLPVIPPKKSQS